jgi:hypothetical protein
MAKGLGLPAGFGMNERIGASPKAAPMAVPLGLLFTTVKGY